MDITRFAMKLFKCGQRNYSFYILIIYITKCISNVDFTLTKSFMTVTVEYEQINRIRIKFVAGNIF